MHPIVEFLQEIDRNPGHSPRELLDTILFECRKFTAAEAGTIFLVRSDSENPSNGAWLEPMSLQNDSMDLEPTQIIVPIDETSIAGYVAVTGESLLIDDAYDLPADAPYELNSAFDASTGYRTHSVACIALRRQDGGVSAVVQLINRLGGNGETIAFERDQADFIAAAGVVMTGVIDRARMVEQLAASNRELVDRNEKIEALQEETEIALLEAEKSDRAKSEFLNCIGHELRTPLNAIIGFSELLKNEGFGPLGHPSYKEFAGEVTDGGHRLLGIVEDILGIVQAETETKECADGGDAAYSCVVDTCRAWFDKAAEKNIVFSAEISDNPANCVIDASHLQTILDRLIDNAIKFTLAGGEIEVYAGPGDQGGLDVKLSDTGVGMTQAEILKVLAPFGQADSTLSRSYEGAGLGLTLSSALAHSMNGTFHIESEPGKGSTIVLHFPPDISRKAAGTPQMAAAPAMQMWVSG
jgi:signal transduction histidine kinase